MVARIVHFGIDDFYRLRALRDAGYSVDSCNSLAELRLILNPGVRVDAVAISETDGATPQSVITLARSVGNVPLILFQGWTRNWNESEFNLVVPVLRSEREWLKDIAALIAHNRVQLARAQAMRTRSSSSRGQSIKVAERSSRAPDRPEKDQAPIPDPFAVEPGPANPKQELFRRLNSDFFRSMPTEVLGDFIALATISSCPSGTVLFIEEQTPHEIFVVLEGRVKMFVNSSDGKRLIVHVAGPGQILGLGSAFTGNPHLATAETLYPCKIASFCNQDFLSFLMIHPRSCHAAARELSLSMDQACTRLRTIGVTHSNKAKLARLLLEWSAEGKLTGSGTQIHINLTHVEIGECLGTCRESVSRIFRDFQLRRIIDVHGSILTITDLPALERCADIH
jgi:CRP/FNR family transcriptional regulator